MDNSQMISENIENQKSNNDEALYCVYCGNKLLKRTIFCPICGNKIVSDSNQNQAECSTNDNKLSSYSSNVEKNSSSSQNGKILNKEKLSNSVQNTEKQSHKKNTKRIALFAIFSVFVIIFVAQEIIIRYRRKIVDFYEIVHTMDEETFEKFFALDEKQSVSGSINTYILDEHHAYITFYENEDLSVSVQLEDYGDKYEYRFHRMAGHKLFETPEDFENDKRFAELIRRDNVVYYDDLDYSDAYLKLYIDEHNKAYNIIYDIMPDSDKEMDEMLVTFLAYPEEFDNTTVSEAGKERAEDSGIDISDLMKQYYDDYSVIDPNDDTQEINFNGQSQESQNTISYSDDEICRMASEYYYVINGQMPPLVDIDSIYGNELTLHLYERNGTNTATWDWYYIDRITLRGTNLMGDPIDLNEVIAANNIELSFDNQTSTIPEYFVYVNAPDGYVNLREGPGTEYNIICPIPNGEALEVYPEDATASNGKKWLKVAYNIDDGWNIGYVIASQVK